MGLRCSIALVIVGALSLLTTTTHAQARTDGLYAIVSTTNAPARGAIAVTSEQPPDHPPLWMRTRRARGARAVLYATDNTNGRYRLLVRYTSRRECERTLLRLGAHAVASDGWSQSDDDCSANFGLDRALATLAAAHFDVPRQDRQVMGEALRGTFAAAARTIRSGSDLEVILTIRNPPAASAIKRFVGGRQRGPRNNRFTFVIERDGQNIAPIEAMDFGGVGGFMDVAPGTSGEVREHLSRWGDITAPGHYVVRCRYETELTGPQSDPFDDARRGERWDRTFEGVIRFTVRRP